MTLDSKSAKRTIQTYPFDPKPVNERDRAAELVNASQEIERLKAERALIIEKLQRTQARMVTFSGLHCSCTFPSVTKCGVCRMHLAFREELRR
ncbi:MAG: hypothetical protein ACI88C_000083 [Acidimicrobiales bacterium]|jgi:hypothetical protein